MENDSPEAVTHSQSTFSRPGAVVLAMKPGADASEIKGQRAAKQEAQAHTNKVAAEVGAPLCEQCTTP